MKIIYTKTAVKAIDSFDKTTKNRIRDGIVGLIEFPPRGDIKRMKAVGTPIYRLRIGKYRILYEYVEIEGERVLLIKDIGSRGDIYK